MGVHDFRVNGEGQFREERQKAYNRMVEGMVKELCTNYGELFEIWFDGGADHPANGAPDVLPIVQRYQPNCLFYHNRQLAEVRWGGSESGTVPYPCWASFPNYYSHAGNTAGETLQLLKTGDPDGAYWMPAMSDAPLRGYNGRHEWFWEPGDEAHIYPVNALMKMYYQSVGRNSTLIMGLTPDPDGLLPQPDVDRLKEWGDQIRSRFDHPLAARSGSGKMLELNFEKPSEINHIILQEDIAMGENVRRYRVEAKLKGKWTSIATGTAIGQKHIQYVETITCSALRLVIEEADDKPIIRQFAAYNVPGFTPF